MMIASIQGKILRLGDDYLVVDAGGIGYQVFVPTQVFDGLSVGELVSLYTQLIVREDSLTLFGFRDQEELVLFQELIRVNGVGPRLALETLATHSTDVIKRAVLNKQEEIFSQVAGVGKKTAQKIILTLEDRISFEEQLIDLPGTSGVNMQVQEALISLGYSVLEAQAALQTIPEDAPLDLETRLTIALRFFS
jgi:Holliday junction DNA helicase RuvA